jgi:hypothetical protein
MELSSIFIFTPHINSLMVNYETGTIKKMTFIRVQERLCGVG